MSISPRSLFLTAVGEAAVLLIVVLDVIAEVGWSEGSLVALRVVAVVGAALVAVVTYLTWSGEQSSSPRRIAAVAAAMVGGASIAAAVTTTAAGRVFGDTTFALIGAAGLLVAVLALQLEARRPS